MRKIPLPLLFLLFVPFVSKAVSVSTPEEFFYQKGYREGFSKGYKKGYADGYKQALKDVEIILKAYKIDIKALEAGKYLVEEGLITAPRVVKIPTPDGGFETKIVGCRIEEPRKLESVSNLAKIPIPVLDKSLFEQVSKARENLVQIPKLSEEMEMSQYSTPPKPIFVEVPESAISILEKLNIPYEIVETNRGKKVIKAVFFKRETYKLFCRQTGLCK